MTPRDLASSHEREGPTSSSISAQSADPVSSLSLKGTRASSRESRDRKDLRPGPSRKRADLTEVRTQGRARRGVSYSPRRRVPAMHGDRGSARLDHVRRPVPRTERSAVDLIFARLRPRPEKFVALRFAGGKILA